MTKISAILTENGLSMTVDGEPKTVSNKSLNYNKILEHLRNGEYDKIPPLLDTREFISGITNGNVTVVGDTVLYKGKELHNSLTRRMLSMMREGLGIEHLVNFLEKLKNNPSHRSVEQLFDFLEACNLPILPNGDFVAYKWVNGDYKDCHTGTIDNSVGAVVSMPRNEVNDNPQQTCSDGLHVCSEGYTKFGQRLMLVAVNPADVVSVPVDYKASKMRVCRYEVFKEIEQPECKDYFDGVPLWQDEQEYDNDDVLDWEDTDDDWWLL